MHNIDIDELDSLICCYVEDLLEKAGYKQTWRDAEIITAFTQNIIGYIELSTNVELIARLRSADPTSENAK